MNITTDFPEATPCEIEIQSPSRARCRFTSKTCGSQTFHFCVRVEGLARGQQAELEVIWPVVTTPSSRKPEPGSGKSQVMMDSFLTVVPKTLMRSRDLDNWLPLAGVRLDEEADTMVVPLVGDGEPIYLASQVPYRPSYYQALLEHVRSGAPDALREIGRSQAGSPLYVVDLPATGADAADAPAVYVQALQHCGEHSGAFVVDTLLRMLLDGEAAQPLRRRVHWQIMPMLDVDGFHRRQDQAIATLGSNVRGKNPNRDWNVGEWPEVAAVLNWWQQQMDAGRRYRACLDLHNGWSNRGESGASYTVFTDDVAGAEDIASQREFIDFMYARTDHEIAKYWASRTAAGHMTCKEAFYRATDTPLSFTVEFSRHMWWDRTSQSYVAPRPDHPRRWAHDMAPAMVEFLGEG
jgi:hypothetical protein